MASEHSNRRYPSLVADRRYRVVRELEVGDAHFRVGDLVTLIMLIDHQHDSAIEAVFRGPGGVELRLDDRVAAHQAILAAVETHLEPYHAPQANECACGHPPFVGAEFHRRVLGRDPTDGRDAEVAVEKCRSCGAHWLEYALTDAEAVHPHRWCRGAISKGKAKRVTVASAVAVLESLPGYFFGGSSFEESGYWGRGPLSLGIVPRAECKPPWPPPPTYARVREALALWSAGEAITTVCAGCGGPLTVTDLPESCNRWVTCKPGCTRVQFKTESTRREKRDRGAAASEPTIEALVQAALRESPATDDAFDEEMAALAKDAQRVLGVRVGRERDTTYAAGQAILLGVNSADRLVAHGNVERLTDDFNYWRVAVNLSSRGKLWMTTAAEAYELPGPNRWGVEASGRWDLIETDPSTLPWWPQLQPLFELLRARGWREVPHAWRWRNSGEMRQLDDCEGSLFEVLFCEV